MRGTASIEIGDVVVPDKSKGMVQGYYGLALPWYDTAVPVMFVKDGDLAGWKRATLNLWQGVCKGLPPGDADTPTNGAGAPCGG